MQLLGHLGRKGGPSIKYVGILSTDLLRAAHMVISNDSAGPPIARDGVRYAPEMTILCERSGLILTAAVDMRSDHAYDSLEVNVFRTEGAQRFGRSVSVFKDGPRPRLILNQ